MMEEKSMNELKTLKWNVLKNIEVICETLSKSHLKIKKSSKYDQALKRLSDFFKINEKEVWLLSMGIHFIFQQKKENKIIPFSEIEDFLDIPTLTSFSKAFKNLKSKKYLDCNFEEYYYTVNPHIISAVYYNKEFPKLIKEIIDYNQFLLRIKSIVTNVYVSDYDSEDSFVKSFYSKFYNLENESKSCPFVKRAQKKFPNIKDRYLFYYICTDFLFENSACRLTLLLTQFFLEKDFIDTFKSFIEQTHPLIKSGLVQLEAQDSSANNSYVELTETGKIFLLQEDYCLYEEKNDLEAMKNPKEIIEHQMIYDEDSQKQIDTINKILMQDNLKHVQNEFAKKGMIKGLAILLYGPPGTGKTESVYQLAKKTNHPIIEQDISQLRNCFYGESEKIIKKVFTNYQRICKKSLDQKESIPILFFNEADAILSVRKENFFSGTTQVENTIQNIILNELEKFEGIFIATTNLINNLDKAFERRFLFKIHLDLPDKNIKKILWQNKLPFLSENEAETLAEDYAFSGGEIDNIARKILIDEVVSGKKACFETINEACMHEKLYTTKSHKMGFCI